MTINNLRCYMRPALVFIMYLSLLTSLTACIFRNPVAYQKGVSISNDSKGTLDPELAGLIINRVSTILKEQPRIPGVQIALSTKGGANLIAAFGHQDKNRSLPITNQHAMQIGSTTKLFTATIIMLLVESGQLRLDDRIDKWFPDFTAANQVSIRNLLNHTSGYKEVLSSISILMTTSMNADLIWDQKEVLQKMSETELDFELGTSFQYSNTNYILLGAIIEQITQRPLHQVFQQRIFKPLHMKHTFLAPDNHLSPEQLITGIDYDFLPLGPHWMRASQTNWSTLAGASGGMISNAEDLLIFHRSLYADKILHPTTLAMLINFQHRDAHFPEASMLGYGLGISEYKLGKFRAWGHRGGIMGFDTSPFYEPESGTLIIVLSNHSRLDSSIGPDIFQEIMTILNQDD